MGLFDFLKPENTRPRVDVGVPSRAARGSEAAFMRSQREQDLTRGKERAKESFAKSGPEEFQQIIDKRRQQLEGLTPEERAAFESQGLGGIQQAEQSALRQLRGSQAAAGVSGPLASSQAGDILQGGLKQRSDLQQDIFLADVAKRREALNQLEGTLGRERAGALGIQFGEAGFGAAERGAATQFLAGAGQANPPQIKPGGLLSKLFSGIA